jgi:hypothetical protein
VQRLGGQLAISNAEGGGLMTVLKLQAG